MSNCDRACPDWAASWEEIVKSKALVQSSCDICGVLQNVDPSLQSLRCGGDAPVLGRRDKCTVVNCEGRGSYRVAAKAGADWSEFLGSCDMIERSNTGRSGDGPMQNFDSSPPRADATPRCAEILQGRYAEIFTMRRAGLTFRQIGQQWGISSGRASQIHRQALRKQALLDRWGTEKPMPDTPIEKLRLSRRAFSTLRNADIRALSEILPLNDAKKRELLRTPNLGRSVLKELEEIVAGF